MVKLEDVPHSEFPIISRALIRSTDSTFEFLVLNSNTKRMRAIQKDKVWFEPTKLKTF